MRPISGRPRMRGMGTFMAVKLMQPHPFVTPRDGERPGKKPKKGFFRTLLTGGGNKTEAPLRARDPRFPQGIRPGMVPAMMSGARPGMMPMGFPRRMPPMMPQMMPRAPQGRFVPEPAERVVDRQTGAVYVRQQPQVQQLREVRMPARMPALVMQPKKPKQTLQQRGERLKTFLLSDEKAGWG